MNDTAPRRGGRYAEGTHVSTVQSRLEIERLLVRFGAKDFTTHSGESAARIGFSIAGRKVMFTLQLPDRNAKEITHYRRGRGYCSWYERAPQAQINAYEKASREKWRALVLLVKAKLAAIDAGIATAEDEFLANTIIPTRDGAATVAEVMQPQITEAYARGVGIKGLEFLALTGGK